VIRLVIALALYRHQSIAEVAFHLDLSLPDEINPDIAKSAPTQARQRLGRARLAQLFAMSASCWMNVTKLARSGEVLPATRWTQARYEPATV
jgi:Insertion element 4 transposase N-terminal